MLEEPWGNLIDISIEAAWSRGENQCRQVGAILQTHEKNHQSLTNGQHWSQHDGGLSKRGNEAPVGVFGVQ